MDLCNILIAAQAGDANANKAFYSLIQTKGYVSSAAMVLEKAGNNEQLLLLSGLKSYIIAHKHDPDLLDDEVCTLLEGVVERLIKRNDIFDRRLHILQDIAALLIDIGRWPHWNPIQHLLEYGAGAAKICATVVKAVCQKTVLSKRSLLPAIPSLLDSIATSVASLIDTNTNMELACARLRVFRLLLGEGNSRKVNMSATTVEFVGKLARHCMRLLASNPTPPQATVYIRQVLKLTPAATGQPQSLSSLAELSFCLLGASERYEALVLKRVAAASSGQTEEMSLGCQLELFALALHGLRHALAAPYDTSVPRSEIVRLLGAKLVSPYMVRASHFEDFFGAIVDPELAVCAGVWAPERSAREASIACLRLLLESQEVRPSILLMARGFLKEVEVALSTLWTGELSASGDSASRFMFALQAEAKLSVFAVVWGYTAMQEWADSESIIAEGYEGLAEAVSRFVGRIMARPGDVGGASLGAPSTIVPTPSLRVLLFALCSAMSECGATAPSQTRPMLAHSLALFANVAQAAPEVQLVALAALGELASACSEGMSKDLAVLVPEMSDGPAAQAFGPALALILTLLPKLQGPALYAALHCIDALAPVSPLSAMDRIVPDTIVGLCNVIAGLPWTATELLTQGTWMTGIAPDLASTPALQCNVLSTILVLVAASSPHRVPPNVVVVLDKVLTSIALSVLRDPEAECVLDCVVDIVHAAVDGGVLVEELGCSLSAVIGACTGKYPSVSGLTAFSGGGNSVGSNTNNTSVGNSLVVGCNSGINDNNNCTANPARRGIDPVVVPRTRPDSSLSTPKASGKNVFSNPNKSPYSQKNDALAGTPPVAEEPPSRHSHSNRLTGLIHSSLSSADISPTDEITISPLGTLSLLADLVTLMPKPFLESGLGGIYAVMEKAIGCANTSVDAKLLDTCGDLFDLLLCRVAQLCIESKYNHQGSQGSPNSSPQGPQSTQKTQTTQFIPHPAVIDGFFAQIPVGTLVPFIYAAAVSALYQATVGLSTLVPVSRLINANLARFADVCRIAHATGMRPRWIEDRDWEGVAREVAASVGMGVGDDTLLLAVVNRLPQVYDDTRRGAIKLVLVRTQLNILRLLPAVVPQGLRLVLSKVTLSNSFAQPMLTAILDLMERSSHRHPSHSLDNLLLIGMQAATESRNGLIRKAKTRLRETDDIEQDFEGRNLLESVRVVLFGLAASAELGPQARLGLGSISRGILSAFGLA